MTPQEKGDEFTATFYHEIWGINNAAKKVYAKNCAIKAVEEIIKAIDFDWMEVQNLDRINNYWNEVLNYLKSKL